MKSRLSICVRSITTSIKIILFSYNYVISIHANTYHSMFFLFSIIIHGDTFVTNILESYNTRFTYVSNISDTRLSRSL